MIARAARWLTVWLCAFAYRHNASSEDLLAGLSTAYPHRDSAWRMGVLEDARVRNDRRKVHA